MRFDSSHRSFSRPSIRTDSADYTRIEPTESSVYTELFSRSARLSPPRSGDFDPECGSPRLAIRVAEKIQSRQHLIPMPPKPATESFPSPTTEELPIVERLLLDRPVLLLDWPVLLLDRPALLLDRPALLLAS